MDDWTMPRTVAVTRSTSHSDKDITAILIGHANNNKLIKAFRRLTNLHFLNIFYIINIWYRWNLASMTRLTS